MNVDLLLKVKERILVDPDHFGMDHFIFESVCQTTRCIGGWAQHLAGDRAYRQVFRDDAGYALPGQRELGLTDHEAARLFYIEEWPMYFSAYSGTGHRSTTAKNAALRIDHFIATEGRE